MQSEHNIYSECKILILDDDKLVTSSLKSLLILEGFDNAVFFNSPNSAIEYLNKNYCDVIISDFMMEEMNGLEFLLNVKKLYPNASMILLTGYADKENAIRAINEVGLYKYIEKPWDNDDIIINIKNAYERTHLIECLEKTNSVLKDYSTHLEDLVREKTADITEINERLSAIINNCADSIVVTEQSGFITEVNPAAESLFGMCKEILITKNLHDLFETQEPENDWNKILNSKKEKVLKEINAINIVEDKKIPVEISIAYIIPKSEKEEGNFVLVIRNIHYRKEIDRLREDFIATLTHDLRTPSLASIQTLEYFLNGKLGELNSKQTMLLKTMKKSHEDMLGLVNTLLEVYKYESGRLKLIKTSFNFEQLIDECIAQIKPIADSKNQHIEKICTNLDNKEIIADRNELRRVIINLLGNAVKYTQNGGEIELRSEINNKDLHFAIKDNGEGIHKKDIPLLFKRFSQGTQTKRSISTGLGLYLSKQIIDAHGGKIWLESDKGKGSEFFFVLLDVLKSKEEDKVWTI